MAFRLRSALECLYVLRLNHVWSDCILVLDSLEQCILAGLHYVRSPSGLLSQPSCVSVDAAVIGVDAKQMHEQFAAS